MGEPGVLQSMGSQRVKHDLVTQQQQQYDLPLLLIQMFHLLELSFFCVCAYITPQTHPIFLI